MPPRFPSELLRSLRNDIPISDLIRFRLDVPWKERDGYFRFLCPRCGDFHTATYPTTNLACCFRCGLNFNPIDLVMAVEGCGFVEAVKILTPLLEVYPRRSVSEEQKSPG